MKRLFKIFSFLSVLGLILAVAACAAVYFILLPELPSVEEIQEVQLQVPLRIYSQEGDLIAEFGDKRRIPLDYRHIPEQMRQAILASEDDRFFEHPGVDYHGILRAVLSLVTTGKATQGGSTITMQLARNLFFDNKRNMRRKLKEIIVSFKLEHNYSKEEILALYLNKIFLGQRAYGVGAAAKVYYGKSLDDLSLPQYAMIAGLPKAPSTFNPVVNPDRATLRRNYVLRRMFQLNYIDEATFEAAKLVKDDARYHKRDIGLRADFVAEMVRAKMVEKYGDTVFNDGYNVITTLRTRHQQAANDAIHNALLAYDRRHGYRGAIAQIALPADSTPAAAALDTLLKEHPTVGPLHTALVTGIADNIVTLYSSTGGELTLTGKSLLWARQYISTNKRGRKIKSANDVLARGDIVYVRPITITADDTTSTQWQLAQIPLAQGAIVAVSPFDGAITALNGGFDYFQSKFNRATQSARQPGSGFKPFLYSAALDNGYTAASVVNDTAVVYDGVNAWRPQNASLKFYGPTRLRVALTYSRNLVSIRLLREIGIDALYQHAQKFGFTPKQMPRDLSLALGSGSATPLNMARAYSALANGGYRIEPYFISRIEDPDGNLLMQSEPATVCDSCFATTSMPAAVVTADAADSIDAPAEAKAGTPTAALAATNAPDGFNAAPRIISPQNAYLMNSMLRDVTRIGTGKRSQKLGRKDLAGKTGTTNDQVDAWFNGFHPELVAISWVGFDKPKTLGRGEYGGKAALPMWMDFMRVALDGVPNAALKLPPEMVSAVIDPKTGLLAKAGTPGAMREVFRSSLAPSTYAPLAVEHGGDASSAVDVF